MRKPLAVLLVLLATAAWAGEALLGRLVVTDGGTTTNRCTLWHNYAGGSAFVVSPLSKISIQCDGDAYVLTDVAGCDAGQCLKVTSGTIFPTSVNTSKTLTCKAFASDAGTAGHAVTYTGGHVAMACASGPCTCGVYSRKGDE